MKIAIAGTECVIYLGVNAQGKVMKLKSSDAPQQIKVSYYSSENGNLQLPRVGEGKSKNNIPESSLTHESTLSYLTNKQSNISSEAGFFVIKAIINIGRITEQIT